MISTKLERILALLKSFIPFLKPYKKQLILGPIFKLLEAIFELMLPIYLAKLIDQGLIHNHKQAIWSNFVIIIILSLIGLGCVFLCQYFAAKASQGFGTDLRNYCFRKIQSLSEKQKLPVPALLTRLTSDINQMQQAIAMLIRLVIRAPFLSIGSVIAAFFINPFYGWLFTFILPCFIIILLLIMIKTVPIYKKAQLTTDQITQNIKDNLEGQEIIRSFNQTDYMLNKFEKINSQYTKTATNAGIISSYLQPSTIAMVNASIICILFISNYLLHNNEILPGQILALVTYINQMLLSLIVISNLVTIFTKSYASADRLSELFNTSEVNNSANTTHFSSDYNLVINKVSYQYPNSHFKLQDINLTIDQGNTLCITGPSGSGKSTLLYLLAGFFNPSNGVITCDNKNISTNFKSYNHYVAIAEQKATLFKGTIRSNLLFAKPKAKDKELWHALKIAAIDNEIKNMPNQLDTPVEEFGKNFSGGQRQRIALARTLLKKAKILLLDNPTSALDNQTSQKIFDNLLNYYPQVTKIIVTQKLNILRQSPHIVILEQGKITSFGTHHELTKKSQLYKLLIQKQQEEQKCN